MRYQKQKQNFECLIQSLSSFSPAELLLDTATSITSNAANWLLSTDLTVRKESPFFSHHARNGKQFPPASSSASLDAMPFPTPSASLGLSLSSLHLDVDCIANDLPEDGQIESSLCSVSSSSELSVPESVSSSFWQDDIAHSRCLDHATITQMDLVLLRRGSKSCPEFHEFVPSVDDSDNLNKHLESEESLSAASLQAEKEETPVVTVVIAKCDESTLSSMTTITEKIPTLPKRRVHWADLDSGYATDDSSTTSDSSRLLLDSQATETSIPSWSFVSVASSLEIEEDLEEVSLDGTLPSWSFIRLGEVLEAREHAV